MYERMLNKQEQPTFDEMIGYCGENGNLWLDLDEWLTSEFAAEKLIRFPYGNEYGWGVKYNRKSKHICDIFAESGAFAALFQISGKAVDSIYDELGDYAKSVWADKSPCGTGGWIEYRVTEESQLDDLKKLIRARIKGR